MPAAVSSSGIHDYLVSQGDDSYVKPIPVTELFNPNFDLDEFRRERLGHSVVTKREASRRFVKICAPMVRFSKLPFRLLVKKWGTDLAFTPMIMANVFKNSSYGRDCEFSTNSNDVPCVIQFASNSSKELADAAEIAAPFVSGIDLNCGCPQRWAFHECIGSYLMTDPELVSDMIRAVKARTSPLFPNGLPISVKIRLSEHDDPTCQRTVDYARQIQYAGADFITVHGRNRRQKSTVPCNYEAIKLVRQSVDIPVVANGSIFSLEQANSVVEATGVQGVMAARGLLANPAMFDERKFYCTPPDCVLDFIDYSIESSLHSNLFQRHLAYMLPISKIERKAFNELSTKASMISFLKENYFGW